MGFRKSDDLLKSTRKKVYTNNDLKINIAEQKFHKNNILLQIENFNQRLKKIFKNSSIKLLAYSLYYLPILEIKFKYHDKNLFSGYIDEGFTYFDLNSGEMILNFSQNKQTVKLKILYDLNDIEIKMMYHIYKNNSILSDKLFYTLHISSSDFEKYTNDLLEKNLIFDYQKNDEIYYKIFEEKFFFPVNRPIIFKNGLNYQSIEVGKFNEAKKDIHYDKEKIIRVFETIYENIDATKLKDNIIYIPKIEFEIKKLFRKEVKYSLFAITPKKLNLFF